jgi:4-carboxymuconolactone decarboxylase
VPTESEAQSYIDQMVEKRGYVLDYHKVMAAADFPVLQAANLVVSTEYLNERTLDRKTKELLFILSLTVMRAPLPQIKSHIRVGLDLGLTPTEILEAIEIALPEAGIVAFQYGVEAWQEVVGIEPLEPTVEAHTGKDD